MNAPDCLFKDRCNGKCSLAVRYVPRADCPYMSKCLCYRHTIMEKERQQKPTDPNEYEDREEHARDVWPY